MSNIGDISRPLNARSLALSVLLGTHPPRLPASSLVALAELFGMTGGTMRTALSRLTATGDLIAVDGQYTLSPRLVARQVAQDAGRRAPTRWDGEWHTAIAVAEQRELADRRRVRGIMASGRFGEVRPTVWMRPANLGAPELGPDASDWLVTTGPVAGCSDAELAARLWDLDTISAEARALSDAAERTLGAIDRDDAGEIPGAFVRSAQIVRFLRDEPLLPLDVTGPDWPVPALRANYDALEHVLHAMLRPFLRAHEPQTGV